MRLKIYFVFCAFFLNIPNSLQFRNRDNQIVNLLSNLMFILGKDKGIVEFGNREKHFGKPYGNSPTPSNDPFICPGFKLYVNLADCGTYYNCQEGVPVLVTCPSRMQFNEKLQVCDRPSIDTCRPTSSSIPVYPMSSQSPSLSPSPLPSPSLSLQPSPPYSDFKCPGDKFYVNVADCGTFFNCQTGKPFLVSCLSGLQFNEKIQVCDWPSMETCKPDLSPISIQPKLAPISPSSLPSPSPSYSGFKCPGPMLYANLANCGTYFNCQTKSSVLVSCPIGMQFNERLQVCDWPSKDSCKRILNTKIKM